jgi:iron(III) transport system permease protein
MIRLPLRGGSPRSAPVFLWLPALAAALFSLLPLYYLGVRSSERGFAAWRETASHSLDDLMANSLLLAAIVLAGSLAIALPAAWLTTRTDLPWRRAWTVALTLPLATPSYVMGLAVVSAAGPRGLFQDWLEPLGVDRLPEIYGLPAAAFTLTAVSYPYLFVILRAALRTADPSVEESARALGGGPWRAFAGVTLPGLAPAIAAGSLLIVLYALSDFGGVATTRYTTFTRAIFIEYTSSFDRTRAAILGVMLTGVAAAILLLELVARSRYEARVRVARTRPPRPVELGRWRWPGLAFVAFVVIVAEVLPIFVLAWWLTKGIAAGTDFPAVMAPLRHSLVLATGGAGLAVLAGMAPSILAARFAGFVPRMIEQLAFLSHALPGLVVALALVFFGIGYARPLYQTVWLMLGAYVVLFLPNALGAMRAPLMRLNPHLEEAGASLGRRPASVLAGVTLPLALPGAIAGFALVFLTIVKELPATLLLSPPGYQTLAGVTWSASSAAFYGSAALPALILIALAAAPIAVLTWRGDVDDLGA